MTEPPSKPPAEIRAGDTLQFTRTVGGYPASAGWALSYALVGGTQVYAFSSTASGDQHAVVVAAATTAVWLPGSYRLVEAATRGAERFTLSDQPVRILVNSAALLAGVDLRTHAEKVLANIEAWLEAKAPVAASFEIAGKKLSQYPLADLLKLRDTYRAEVSRERQVAAGAPPVRLLTRL
jgi:hypothetical protein